MALEHAHTKQDGETPAVTVDETDRRMHLRLSAEDLLWLQGVRIKYGSEVRIVDISAGGILIETDTELKRDASLVFEVSGPDSTLLVPSRVLRCERVTNGGMTRYRIACAFKRPLSIPDFTAAAESTDAAQFSEPSVSAAASSSARSSSSARAIGQKVIARFLDGRLVRGYTNDFNASKPHLHLTEDGAPSSQFVEVSQLKALFFVREFAGNAGRVDRKDFHGATHGRKVEVTFHDGEVLVGSTLAFRGPEHPFFVQPADTDSNNLRIFVTQAATQTVRFL